MQPTSQRLQIGEFVATPTEVTVAGQQMPIAGTSWRHDESAAFVSNTPMWAFIVAILLIPCTAFLSLLLLLIKEQSVTGYVTVQLQAHGMGMSTQIFVADAAALTWVREAVRQAQEWSIAGRTWP